MSERIIHEFYFFLMSVFYGMLIFFLYDCIRIVRRIIPHIGFLVGLEDIIFWVISGIMMFQMMYKQNNGIIRGFVIVGISIGMVIYLHLFSNLLVNGMTKIIKTILHIIKKIIIILLKPFIWFGKRIVWILSFVGRKVQKIIKFMMKPLKKSLKTVKISFTKK